mgnify:CR=1 FL=1
MNGDELRATQRQEPAADVGGAVSTARDRSVGSGPGGREGSASVLRETGEEGREVRPEPPSAEPVERLRRRVERKALLLLAALFALLLARGDAYALFVLTVTGAVAIVSFRGLAAQVRGLSRQRGGGLHFGLLRLGILALTLVFVARLGLTRPLALYLGLAVVPAALMLEALHQLFEADP